MGSAFKKIIDKTHNTDNSEKSENTFYCVILNSNVLDQWLYSQTIKHQKIHIIPMMTSALSISIFPYFPSLVFLMLNIPVCCLLKGICFLDFSFQSIDATKPDQISKTQCYLFTIWHGININRFTLILNTCLRIQA